MKEFLLQRWRNRCKVDGAYCVTIKHTRKTGLPSEDGKLGEMYI